ncbi:MAG TPA: hypothetical protein VK929_08120 [Longimicrobiales bacterium]|nr:hypothetical protein [Longimicrobiales bacterium]
MTTRLVALVLLLIACVPAALRAQLPADANWHTVETTHFRVTFHDGLEAVARRAAASAERAHGALSALLADAPRGTIDIVVSDNIDLSNGYATPFPSNRIVIYAKPPVDLLELQYVEDWIDLVIVHELAHVFHLDVAGPVGRGLRTVFGRVPFAWPFFPAVATPRWSVEGLAVGIESTLTGAGRVHGSYNEMVVRTAVLEGRMEDIDRVGSMAAQWPGPARAYIYGSLFMDYLTRRYGPDATARIVRSTASAVIPPALWFGGAGRSALGVTFRTAYEEWQRELASRYDTLAATLQAHGLTRGEALTDHGGLAMYPRYAPDGGSIAYAASDLRTQPRVRVIDAATGGEQWARRVNDAGAPAWLPDGRVITQDLEFRDRFRLRADLRVLDADGSRRITRSARLQHPDASADGRRVIAVQSQGGTNRLVLVDPMTGGIRPLTDYDDDVHWTLPRFAPDGQRIAAGRWSDGGVHDVVVLDTLGAMLIQVTNGEGISDAPAWSPDGHWLLFWSDRTGIPNIFAAEIGLMGGDRAGAAPGSELSAPQTPRVSQVTNVLTGAYHPDVSPDGRWIAYSAYHHDGFRIERLPFDTAGWRAPLPATVTELARARPVHASPEQYDAASRRVLVAAVSADTVAGPVRPYHALRHLRPYGWFPVLEAGGYNDPFVGFSTWGVDLVGRHRWDLTLSISPASGQTQGRAAYRFEGLPARAVFGMHPTLSLGLQRSWDLITLNAAQAEYIDEREDRAELVLGLDHVRWRSRFSLALAGEVLRRSRDLYGFADGTTLRDPDDDMVGVRGSAGFAHFSVPAVAISREDGLVLQLSARQRRDRNPRTFADPAENQVVMDGGYREVTTWNAGYLAMPLPGFARHVLATRASGLVRSGPGAGTAGIGGFSGAPVGLGLPGISGDVGGSTRLLPIRGFEEGARRGTRAWTASAEYRAPLARLGTSLRPLPFYLDRSAVAVFADAGHAWCDSSAADRLPAAVCPFTEATATPLLSAGAELTTFISAWGLPVPVRAGFALPVQGPGKRRPSAYLSISSGF